MSEFLTIQDPFGHPVLVHRAMAEQSAASGMPVLLAIPVDAVRLALSGKSLDPRERFSDADHAIADAIDEHGTTPAAELVTILDDAGHIIDVQGIRDRFRPGLPLRTAGYTSKGRRGYSPPVHGEK